jgi:hypothetical protein
MGSLEIGNIALRSQTQEVKMHGGNIDLLELARVVKDGGSVSEEEFIELMQGVLPIDSLKDITPEESEWLFMAITWLFDYTLLLWELQRDKQDENPASIRMRTWG